MTGDTTVVTKSGEVKAGDSRIFNCSVRSIIALVIVLTICYLSIVKIKVEEPLYTLAGMVVGFYMGQKHTSKGQQ